MGTRTLDPTVEPIRFPFNERKALAADTHLLAVSDGGMAYMRLLKLLYLSGRAALLEYGCLITGDRYIAMKLGPVLSNVYDRIKEGEWGGRIRTIKYDARLIGPELTGPLSEAGVNLLDEVSRFCQTYDHWNLSDLTHELPEWGETPRNQDIPVERILDTLRKSSKEIKETAEEARDETFFEEVFSDS
ncbi:Panacea domain-containing protein [Leptospirillum ferriphilum]|jgi:uncharacterized phage-associated protein|uniref:Antitoxin SocA-like Panacea domain-containing protein n=4 Tax=Leptospirillum TaxID=179 RepID=A0A1V3SWT6_9BACT|nr:Panacea domain-containing protein [Leptospirillum ferriphilum]AFS53899.1 hypothetical protein LFML04_1697 [Leptospirillum ferriphilum ML-04]EDZ38329.1 MAG: Hypothetical protein CGL2_11278038 [Leptospirillum sp. Group II '5-way CG']OOH73574.1 hypothetical protein BOX24_03590 [Leptospirillum ferriphilum]